LKRFLFINPFGIGDVLFTMPVVRAIKEASDDNRIGYWCNERVGDILRNNPHISGIFALSRGDLKKIYATSWKEGIYRSIKLFNGLKKGRFDISLDFSLDHRYSLMTKLAGVKKRIGFNYRNRGRFLTHKVDIEGYTSKPAADYYLGLLSFLDIKPRDKRLELFVPESDNLRSRAILSQFQVKGEDLIIGLAPGGGASWGKDSVYKHWPAMKFAKLADKLADSLGARILILGDATERPIADIIVNVIKNPAIDLVGKTSLNGLAAMISNLRLLVTNDSGLLHLATALRVKTVSIFGPVDESVYGPYPLSVHHKVIKANIPCRPCYKNFRFPGCINERRCLEGISVEEVYQAVESLI